MVEKMDLIKFEKRNDYGPEWIVKIINTDSFYPGLLKNRSLLQLSVSWSEYVSFPYLHFTMGGNGLMDLMIIVYKFGIDIDIMSYTWKFDKLQ